MSTNGTNSAAAPQGDLLLARHSDRDGRTKGPGPPPATPSGHADGAGEWRMLWRLAVPLTRPALMTVAIFDALQVWNGFLFPLILAQSPGLQVLPLALFSYQGQYTINVPAIMAAVVLSMLPILALYIVGRRQLLRADAEGVVTVQIPGHGRMVRAPHARTIRFRPAQAQT